MSLQAIRTPGRYSNAYGNMVYQVTSDEQTTKYKFRFVFDVYMNNERIARLKVTPQNDDWGQTDIARIIQSFMESSPRNMGAIGDAPPLSKADWGWMDADWLLYRVLIGQEYSDTPTGDPVLYNGFGETGDPLYDPSGDRFVSNSVKEWFNKNTDLSPFFLKSTNLPGGTDYNAETRRFLTNSPRIRYVRDTDWGTLSALNFTTDPEYIVSDPVFCMLVEFYDVNDALITTGVTYNVVYNGGWRLNCDEDTSQQFLYPDWYKKMVTYVGAFPQNIEQNVGFPPNVKYYRVSLQKSIDDPVPPTPTPSNTPLPSGYVPPAEPTPTPTPTPSSSSVGCSTCNRYSISNLSKATQLNYTYTDCDTGLTRSGILPAESSRVQCSCDIPVRTGGSTNFTINYIGICR